MYSSTQSDEARPHGPIINTSYQKFTGSTEVMEAALTGISGMLFVCFLLCGLAVYSTGRS